MTESSLAHHAPAQEVHHAVPRCLLALQERASADDLDGEAIQLWMEYEHEAMRWGVDVEISRRDLAALVEQSTVILDREEHRLIHQSDFARWGSWGGRETVRKYGTQWMVYLALKRWDRITAEDLDAVRLGPSEGMR